MKLSEGWSADEVKKSLHDLELLSQPVDLAELERQGVISKSGAWYRVPNLNALPKDLWPRIKDIDHDRKGGAKVKFIKGGEKVAAKLLKMLRSELDDAARHGKP
jgi:hypothetical protein